MKLQLTKIPIRDWNSEPTRVDISDIELQLTKIPIRDWNLQTSAYPLRIVDCN